MGCCCDAVLDLCSFPVCGELEIEQAATAADSGVENIWKLVLDYLNISVTLEQEQVEGENIKFDISSLNEDYQYTGQIFDSAGTRVTINVSDDGFDCVKFKTKVNVNL